MSDVDRCPTCGQGLPPEHPLSGPTFTNHSKRRMWTEEECRIYLNAALLYLSWKEGGRIDLPVAEILKACEEMGAVAMSLSDDDAVMTITGMKKL